MNLIEVKTYVFFFFFFFLKEKKLCEKWKNLQRHTENKRTKGLQETVPDPEILLKREFIIE